MSVADIQNISGILSLLHATITRFMIVNIEPSSSLMEVISSQKFSPEFGRNVLSSPCLLINV